MKRQSDHLNRHHGAYPTCAGAVPAPIAVSMRGGASLLVATLNA